MYLISSLSAAHVIYRARWSRYANERCSGVAFACLWQETIGVCPLMAKEFCRVGSLALHQLNGTFFRN